MYVRAVGVAALDSDLPFHWARHPESECKTSVSKRVSVEAGAWCVSAYVCLRECV